VKATELVIFCDVCSSPNYFDDEYAKNLRYVAWVKCLNCKQMMNLSDEVKRAGWEGV
jgi:hypothetical protein